MSPGSEPGDAGRAAVPHGSRRRLRSLHARLVVSHLAVVAAGALAMVAVAGLVTREVYGRRLGRLGGVGGVDGTSGPQGGAGAGGAAADARLRALLDDALRPALLAGVAAALVVGLLAAWWTTRRIARPVVALRGVTRRLAAGEFRTPLPVVTSDRDLAALADDVGSLAEHLAATEQRRSHLMAEVTHELRTPLTVIRGHMEALLDGDVEASPEVFAVVADETSRMQRLVDDLALLSRAEEGRLELRPVTTDVAVLVGDAVRRLRPQFDFAEVSVVTELEPAEVSLDRDRMLQVVVNLLGNALAHTPAGGCVTVATSADHRQVSIVIADTGSGIEASELPHLFERFYRGTRTRAGLSASTGRGLGLTIARGLARAHGGDISASSAGPGCGATFTVTVPREATPVR